MIVPVGSPTCVLCSRRETLRVCCVPGEKPYTCVVFQKKSPTCVLCSRRKALHVCCVSIENPYMCVVFQERSPKCVLCSRREALHVCYVPGEKPYMCVVFQERSPMCVKCVERRTHKGQVAMYTCVRVTRQCHPQVKPIAPPNSSNLQHPQQSRRP